MKTTLTFFALLISFASFAQINVTSNPTNISAGNTTVNEVTINRGYFSIYPPRLLTVIIKMPGTNSGTIQVNTISSDVSSSPAYSADGYLFITVRDTFWIKQSNGSDSFQISW